MNRVKEIRQAKGLNQRQLAELSHTWYNIGLLEEEMDQAKPATACRAIAYPTVSCIKHRIGEMEGLAEGDAEDSTGVRGLRRRAIPRRQGNR